jgi:hypothetical protein
MCSPFIVIDQVPVEAPKGLVLDVRDADVRIRVYTGTDVHVQRVVTECWRTCAAVRKFAK